MPMIKIEACVCLFESELTLTVGEELLIIILFWDCSYNILRDPSRPCAFAVSGFTAKAEGIRDQPAFVTNEVDNSSAECLSR